MSTNDRDDDRDDKKEDKEPQQGGLYFDCSIAEEPVTVKLPGGQVKQFVLRELEGPDLESWQNESSRRMGFGNDGEPIGIKDFTDYRPSLISRCLYDPETSKRVPKKEIRTWKSFILQSLFLKCRDMNGLNLTKAESSKKE